MASRYNWDLGDLIVVGQPKRKSELAEALSVFSQLVAKYSPDQPRDNHGRWSSGGGAYTDVIRAKGKAMAEIKRIQSKGSKATDEEITRVGELATGEIRHRLNQYVAASDKLNDQKGKLYEKAMARVEKLVQDPRYKETGPTNSNPLSKLNNAGRAYMQEHYWLKIAALDHEAAKMDKNNNIFEANHKALAQIRPLGDRKEMIEFDPRNGTSNSGESEVVKASEYFPTAWWQASAAKLGRLAVYDDGGGRGFYMHATNSIHLSPTLTTQGKRSYDPAEVIHETAHQFEYAMPQLGERMAAYRASRAPGESPRWLGPGYAKSEIGLRDKFKEPYFGKVYDKGATEMLTMGAQSLFVRGINQFADDNHRNFTFGVFATQ